jgi:hypothetical protein
MTEITDNLNKSDYSCEILSFFVIVILSALSHFWYIFYGICAGIVCWGVVVLLGLIWLSAARWLPSYGRRLLVKVQSHTRDC